MTTREEKRQTGVRWLKFNAVGAGGIAVQLAALAVLKSALQMNYLAATALAVEAAIIHNYFWHERFTWVDRTTGDSWMRFPEVQSNDGDVFNPGQRRANAMFRIRVAYALSTGQCLDHSNLFPGEFSDERSIRVRIRIACTSFLHSVLMECDRPALVPVSNFSGTRDGPISYQLVSKRMCSTRDLSAI